MLSPLSLCLRDRRDISPVSPSSAAVPPVRGDNDQPGQRPHCCSPHHRHHDSPRYIIYLQIMESVEHEVLISVFLFEAVILLFLDIEYPANSGQMGKTQIRHSDISSSSHISGISTLIENLERKKALSEKAQ